jgi:hypothetical protein
MLMHGFFVRNGSRWGTRESMHDLLRPLAILARRKLEDDAAAVGATLVTTLGSRSVEISRPVGDETAEGNSSVCAIEIEQHLFRPPTASFGCQLGNTWSAPWDPSKFARSHTSP